MRRLVTIAVLLLFLIISCQKDSLFEAQLSTDEKIEEQQVGNDVSGIEVYKTLEHLDRKFPKLSSKIESELALLSNAKDETPLSATDIIVTPRENGEHILVGFMDAFDGAIYKLTLRTDAADQIVDLGVLEIKFSDDFRIDFFAGTAKGEDFAGRLRMIKSDDYLSLKNGDTFQDQIDDCWELNFW